MSWHSPQAFFLLIPLLVIFIYWIFFQKNPRGTFFYPDLSSILKNSSSLRASLKSVPKYLKLLAMVFVIIALARPQNIEHKTNQTQQGVDIMLVMDISHSMLVEDMGSKLTRLETSKKVVREFIKGRPTDRIGLIVFSGESFTKIPLTFDHKLLERSLEQIKTLNEIKSGTAIGVALANATNRLQHSAPESRIIIFLTDGDNNTGFIDPDIALQIVRKNKIKVYTIGLGSSNGTFPINYEIKNPNGTKYYRRVYVKSYINKELMKKISSQTGGEFFMAQNVNSLTNIFKKIDELEKQEIQINKWTKYTEHFEIFLQFGLILYFLSVFLSLTVFFRGI